MSGLQVQIDFGGFYETLHGEQCERAVISATSVDDDNGEFIGSPEFDKFNEWPAVKNRYASQYVGMLNNELETKIEFCGVDSPKFYNYSTDTITAKICADDEKVIFDKIVRDGLMRELEKWIDDVTTERPGYIPFYSKHDIYHPENLSLLLRGALSVIIDSLGEDYPFFVDDFWI